MPSHDAQTIIAWDRDPRRSLAVVRVAGDKPSAPEYPVAQDALLGETSLVCFQAEAWATASGGAAPLLDAKRLTDAALLARIVLPCLPSHDLPALAEHFGIPAENMRTAPERAAVAARVWIALLDALRKQPVAVLGEMAALLKKSKRPLAKVIVHAAKAALKKGFGAPKRKITDLLPPALATLSRPPRVAPQNPPQLLDVASAAALFAEDGPLAQAFSAYEFRHEQVRMATEVCEAFNDSLLLMAEAGTGTGKSLAYLVPAILWSVKNDDPVIVSTNTKNLQAQLFQKDLPFLERALGGAFRYALIKGRSNYLCVRKFLMLLANAERELTAGQRFDILPLLTWLNGTETGDIAENAGFLGGMESELWGRVSTLPDECLGPRCRHARQCFVRRARQQAMAADIVVANHATVFSELNAPSAVLPEYRCIVFDEAHNLEDVVTSCFEIVAAPWRVPRIFNRLFHAGRRRDRAGSGLFANLRWHLHKEGAALSSEAPRAVSDLVEQCIASFQDIRACQDAFFDAVSNLFADLPRSADRLRYDDDHRPSDWPDVAHALTTFAERLGLLGERLAAVRKIVCADGEDASPRRPGGLAEAAEEVGIQATHLQAVVQDLNALLKADNEDYVFWAQRGRGRRPAMLCAAPLDVAEIMERAVHSVRRSAVFTSATLTAANRFDFVRDRLGLRGPAGERLRTVSLGSSFDFQNQVLLAIPTFLPPPVMRDNGFVDAFAGLAIETLRATHGRGLVLFTSHAMLRAAHPIIRDALAPADIRVYAQGIDGERNRLTGLFLKDTHSVLLGTQSFWEGMDVPGQSLSCLILAKLPFRPHTDPLVSARCEHIERQERNPFVEYMVPDAIIRLKQGFGRLVRTRRDRGVVVLCDSRLVTKSYGRAFRDSLPARAQVFSAQDAMLGAVESFLGK